MSMIFQTIASQLSNVLRRGAKIMLAVFESIAEARIQRAMIESELYRGRYRLRSKNDDDLPLAY